MDSSRPRPAADQSLQAQVTAVLDWWRQAGVDHAFDDTPHQWVTLREVAEETVDAVSPSHFGAAKLPGAAAAAPLPMIGGDRAGWPEDLAGFARWWLTEPSLDADQLRDRIPPRGPVGAPLMVLVQDPEAGDTDSLLSGPQGRLLTAMLSAMGLDPAEVYFASALPRHTPMADWAGLAALGLGAVLCHHIALVRPRRVIAFGRHIPPLLTAAGLESPLAGNAPTQTIPSLPTINHDGGSVALLIARDLGSLLERPIAKGGFWQHWLEWSSE